MANPIHDFSTEEVGRRPPLADGVMRPEPLDLISRVGDIRQHWTLDGHTTLCGIQILCHQRPSGNRTCRRCEVLNKEPHG